MSVNRAPRRRARSAPVLPPRQQRLRVFLRSVDHRVVDQAAVRLLEICERAGGVVDGPTPLPAIPATDSALRIHIRQIDLVNPSASLVARLAHFDLPNGVEIEMAG
jgi:small subunit ribosomal protein S10